VKYDGPTPSRLASSENRTPFAAEEQRHAISLDAHPLFAPYHHSLTAVSKTLRQLIHTIPERMRLTTLWAILPLLVPNTYCQTRKILSFACFAIPIEIVVLERCAQDMHRRANWRRGRRSGANSGTPSLSTPTRCCSVASFADRCSIARSDRESG